MHCEINAWQHYIDLLYLEAVRRGKFDPFVSALAAPIGNRDGDVKEGQPQKTLLRVSDIDSVGERARKQEMLQKSEEDLKQCLQKTGFPHVRHASGKGGGGGVWTGILGFKSKKNILVMKLTGITSYQIGLLAIKLLHWLDITIV